LLMLPRLVRRSLSMTLGVQVASASDSWYSVQEILEIRIIWINILASILTTLTSTHVGERICL
jgi:hypothetical protein